MARHGSHRFLAAGALFAALVSSACAAPPQTPAAFPFKIDLPPGFTVKKEQGPDFDVYRIENGGVQYLGAYLGNYPQTDPDATVSADGRMRQTVKCKPAGGVAGRDIVVQVDGGTGNPFYLDVWIGSDVPEQFAVAQKMLLSIRAPELPDGIKQSDLLLCR